MHLFEALIEPAAALTVIPAATARHGYGGLPGLPAGTDWPSHAGTFMTLLARLDCADLATLLPETWTLPTSGTLLFFHLDDFPTPAPPTHGTPDTRGPNGRPAFTDGRGPTDRRAATASPGAADSVFGPGVPRSPSMPDTPPAQSLPGAVKPGLPGAGMPSGPDARMPGMPGAGMPSGPDAGMPSGRMPGGSGAGMPGAGMPGGSGMEIPGAGEPGLPGEPEHDDACRVLHVPAGLPPRPAPAGVQVIPPLPLAANRIGSVPPYDAPALRYAFTTDPVAAMNARELAEDAAGRPPRHQVLGWQRDAFLHLPGLRPLLQLEAEPGTAWGDVVNVSFWLPEADLATGTLTNARRYLETA